MISKYVLAGISMLFVLTALTACSGGGGGDAAPASGAPTLTGQPTSVTVTAPNTATFTVAATDGPTPTLQ